MRRLMLTSAVWALIAGGAMAQDAALLLGMDSYERLGRVSRGATLIEATPEFEALGFDVKSLRNGRSEAVTETLGDFVTIAEDADRIVIALSGRFATDGTRTWLLTSEAREVGVLTVGSVGVSVESILAVLSARPGTALLLIGADQLDGPDYDDWLRAGVGAFDVPQGVTVAVGSVRDVASFIRTEVTEPANDLAEALSQNASLKVEGFLPEPWVLMPDERVETDSALAVVDEAAEDALWQGALALDTVEAYRNYLRRYPDGRYRQEAETTIVAILAEPNRGARLAEESLGLSRQERREIQRHLTLLDYNTRGIDGIFGPGTRGAITNWQQVNGYSQTSYLTTEQINRLDAQATRRAAELEAEAERKRVEQARLDRTYWEETGAKGGEAGYRAYLGRFPDGLFAEIANERLGVIEEAKRAEAEIEDRSLWERVRAADTVTAYQDYLSAFPEGVFVAEAQARIAELTRADTAEQDFAAGESGLNLNAITMRLIEARLEQLGLEPGAVDGRFDDDSRRAIRRYQQARGLSESGYLTEATLVRLLADFTGIGGR